ncbi:TPA: hypothetical protein DEG21_06275 [Patescibacteria group bacterium]|nr:hypothetical protein [Candidatus Gracilibacteria bacterium]
MYKISFLKEEDFENVSIKEQVEIATNYNFEAKQRDESPKRIKNISKYIETDLGIFPNAIIL